MRKMPLLCLLLWLAAGTVQAQKVSNIRSTLEPSCGYYTITFDLEGKANELYNIKLVSILDDMEIIRPRFASSSGIYSLITSGKDRQIYWNPILEGAGTGEWQFRFEVDASSWIFVEGGSFMMGSDEGLNDETPIHKVSVSSFMMSKCEITQKQWMEFKDVNSYSPKGDNLPVENVSWFEAIDYCNKRSIKEGLEPCYSVSGYTAPNKWEYGTIKCDWKANGYRLPTEAEWEYAARGGILSKGYKYSGSNNLDAVSWYKSNSSERTHDVGTKVANELGLFDMTGNVWEWCWDWHSDLYYTISRESDPQGPESGSLKVLRGGGFNIAENRCLVSSRAKINHYWGYNNSGLRLVRSFR